MMESGMRRAGGREGSCLPGQVRDGMLEVHFDSCAATGFRGVGIVRVLRPGPTEQPERLAGQHVDAAVAHRRAKILVPKSAVKRLPIPGEIAGPWNAGQNVVIYGLIDVGLSHVLAGKLLRDTEAADMSGRITGRDAGRNGRL